MIPFKGSMAMQYTADVAAAFIAAARAHPAAPAVLRPAGRRDDGRRGHRRHRERRARRQGRITSTGEPLPIAADTPGPSLLELVPDLTLTPFADAVAQTAARFAELDAAA